MLCSVAEYFMPALGLWCLEVICTCSMSIHMVCGWNNHMHQHSMSMDIALGRRPACLSHVLLSAHILMSKM